MRLENSIRNIIYAVATQFLIILFGFASRKVFLSTLSIEYLGINALLVNILSMLSLIEGGIGKSITFNLYKPLANHETETIISLVKLYRKVYSYLAIGVLVLSILFYPFLSIFIKSEESVPFIGGIYFIFVFKTIFSYFNAHKWSLINADQRGYVILKYNLFFTLLTSILKIIILLYTGNYILYLVIELLIVIMQTMWNGHIVNQHYPFINTKKTYSLNPEIRKGLIENVKAIYLHNIGSYCVFGTDNLLISSLVSLKMVGYYSNYSMVISQVSSLLTQIIGGFGASVGNLIATENKEKNYQIYKVLYFVNFWLYSVCTICIYILLEDFINVFFGPNLLLPNITLIFILINFYITGMRNPINIFKEKSGIFVIDRYLPLVEAIINLVVSIILVRPFGLTGIFLGTTISTLLIPFWTQPLIVYRQIFSKSITNYLFLYLSYTLVAVGSGFLVIKITEFFICDSMIKIVLKAILVFAMVNFTYILIFYRTKEFQSLLKIVLDHYGKVKSKFSKVELF